MPVPQPAAQLYLLPGDREELHTRLAADLQLVRRRLRMVSFLPPCGKLTALFDQAVQRLPHDAVRVVVDGSTQEAQGRHDAPWLQRRRLPRGTLHAKALVLDDVLWWGSWNWSLAALGQADMMQRTVHAGTVDSVLRWMDEVELHAAPADGAQPRAVYAGQELHSGPPADPLLGF